jgi:hypothetical protein
MTFNDLFPYLFGTMFVAIWAVVGYRLWVVWRAGKPIRLAGRIFPDPEWDVKQENPLTPVEHLNREHDLGAI